MIWSTDVNPATTSPSRTCIFKTHFISNQFKYFPRGYSRIRVVSKSLVSLDHLFIHDPTTRNFFLKYFNRTTNTRIVHFFSHLSFNRGQVLQRWFPLIQGNRIRIDLVFKANSIQVQNNCPVNKQPNLRNYDIGLQFRNYWLANAVRPLRARNRLISSFCPQVMMKNDAKAACCLSRF